MRGIACLAPAWALVFSLAGATATAGDGLSQDERDRLAGHTLAIAHDGDTGKVEYEIKDIAGEGKPVVGVVERRAAGLFLVAGGRSWRLAGPLARPRITGPGYRIWVLGEVSGEATAPVLFARRVGVLAPPRAGDAAMRGARVCRLR